MFRINKSTNKLNFFVSATTAVLFSTTAFSNAIDNEILSLKENKQQLAKGQALFETVCAACHAKDLSGGAGFNLKDGEWIHGNTPSAILKNIGNGFSKAGMPAFKQIYNQEQLKKVTAYILSKREGWDNLTYKIYALEKNHKKNFSVLKGNPPIKSGRLEKNLADFELPEIKDYVIEFEGDFYAPEDYDTVFTGEFWKLDAEIAIDGDYKTFTRSTALKRGKQKLVFRFMSDPKKNNNNLALFVIDNKKRKLFPISIKGDMLLKDAKVNITATTSALVQRKKVLDLPTYSISVGLTQKMNYAFNTRTCSVVGVWQGDLLNIGPNIQGRGKDGSQVLGKWGFHAPEQIMPSGSQCIFNKYNRQGDPSFYYTLDNVDFKLQGKVTKANTLSLEYTVLNNTKGQSNISFLLPKPSGSTISAPQGKVTNNKLLVDITKNKTFSIDVVTKGDK